VRSAHSARRGARVLATVLLSTSVLLGLSVATSAEETGSPVVPTTDAPTDQPEDTQNDGPQSLTSDDTTTQALEDDNCVMPVTPTGAAPHGCPYGAEYPVSVEANFSRPYKSISSQANSDFSLLNDLERLIRGTYKKPDGTKRSSAEIKSTLVYMTISRMENAHRVDRELKAAAKAGVRVWVIHGEASQSKESRSLQKALNGSGNRDAKFRICAKGKSQACLSTVNGAIMHSKILVISKYGAEVGPATYTRDGQPAKAAYWTGSANLGGPSGERTYNNGLTVYNDKKTQVQMQRLFWPTMWEERSVGNDMIGYLRKSSVYPSFGYVGAGADGYTSESAWRGQFYSNLANVTIYPTPIQATPTNGKDPVLNLLNRVKPDSQCRIRLQQNRFKYRRLAVAYKLVELANQGCKVSGVYFEDDLAVNRKAHCQLYIRVCQPILDVFKTADRRIEAAWAKPHDKTILVDALLTRNPLNPEEVAADGTEYGNWGGRTDGKGVVRTRLVQAGSAALTGSNLVASDEVTTETTDAGLYDEYLEHWKAIWKSQEIHRYTY